MSKVSTCNSSLVSQRQPRGRRRVARGERRLRAGCLALLLGAASGAMISKSHGETFGQLPPAVRARIVIRLARPSNEITASPFATLSSFEVHGEAEDEAVIEAARQLGVKHFVLHNIHGSLRDPHDRRLTRWCRLCEQAGIEVRAILHSTDLDLWKAAFVNWGDRIRYWSYLNEPNTPQDNDHTKPLWKPDEYVTGLRAVKELRDRLAPQVKLGGPEVAMLQCMEERPFPWLRLSVEAGLLDNIDFFTFHPYRQGYSPQNIPENPSRFWGWGEMPREYSTYEEQIQELRRRVGHKPLVINEVGWSTTPRGRICEHTQAKFALRQQIMDFALGIEVAVYFLLRERHVGQPYEQWHLENHFGIMHVDNTPKPAYTALQALYAQLDSNCKPVKDVPVAFVPDQATGTLEKPVKWYLFEDRSEAVWTRKLLFWLPVPARDDYPTARVQVQVGEVRCLQVPVDDRPRLLRVHYLDGRWGWPVLIDFLAYQVNYEQAWEPAPP
jgi:hypothetical protein